MTRPAQSLLPGDGATVSVAKTPLLRELTFLQSVIERKNTIPILSTILIQGSGGEISIVGTDLDVSLRTVCPAEVTGQFTAVVQARKFYDIVRNLPDEQIHLVLSENNWVLITSGASEFHLQGQSKENFPSTPTIETFDFTIPAATFNGLIARTAFAITQEESRYALNGALFKLVGGEPLMVATDGHRLALAQARAAVAVEAQSAAQVEQLQVIIPKKALTELTKLTAEKTGDVQVSKDENHLYFKIGARLLTSRMLAGQFPNYDLVIPRGNDKTITVKCEAFTQAVRRASLMADERSHGIKVELSANRLQLSAQSADIGQAREVMPIEYAGESLEVGFNSQYILDFLNVALGDVNVAMKDAQNPVLFTPTADEHYDFRAVVMPMRLI